ncbi:hypothetical protein [Eleftheria terrae]|uniref:hypothetical protein n=1 Tax=Eleftheria terrae TaxID=1597781 RepID=UPI00263A612A|nr:hypothetical protein [Eleftheria terrae]WKB52239.1 hypothetical protein N7L95_20965 [Eleftheria terrae]
MDANDLNRMTDWIERFTARLLARTRGEDPQGAREWAAAAWQEYGNSYCPERTAEAMAVACSGGGAW